VVVFSFGMMPLHHCVAAHEGSTSGACLPEKAAVTAASKFVAEGTRPTSSPAGRAGSFLGLCKGCVALPLFFLNVW